MFNKIFISYATEDFQYAEKLYYYLEKNGFLPWMDKLKLLPGQPWEFQIQQELRKADFIILLLSETSVSKRGYVQKEFNLALTYCQEKLDSDIYLIPIKINSCEVPSKLEKFQWVEYSSQNTFLKILEAINFQRELLIKDDQQKQAKQISLGYNINNKIGEYGQKSPKQIFEIEYPLFIDNHTENSSEINNLIENEVIQYLLRARKNYFENLKYYSGDEDDLFKIDSTLYGKIEFKILSKDFISYTSFWSLYESGAAHGNYWSMGHNYYLNPVRNFDFGNLFNIYNARLPILRDIVHDKLMIKAKNEYDITDSSEFYILPEGLTAENDNFDNYYLTKKGIVFIYNPYHLTAFSYGDHHPEITYDELLSVFPNENKLKEFIEFLKDNNHD